MDYQTIIVEKADAIVTVTLNRPKQLNSFTKRMLEEFDHLWRDVSEDDSAHVVVLRASKESRAFSTGHDIKDDQEPGHAIMHPNIWTAADPGEKLGPKQNRCWKPVIAAVHGMACGGAFYWINECDIILASEEATFFDPHVTYGMTAALEPIGARYRMPLGDVIRMTLLGNDERISAYSAARMGLVSEVLPDIDALWARAHELATKIAAKPPAAIQGSVRAIWESLDLPRQAALQTGLKYCFLGNPIGTAQVDRWSLMNAPKTFETR